MNKNIINNAQLLEIKTKIRQLGAMMNAYQCRFVVSSGQLFFVDDEYAGTVKLTNLDNGESNISFPSCDVGIGFRTIKGATEVANLLVKYNAFKTESRYLAGSYEQFWIMKEGVCPAVKGETGYSKEEFDKIDEKNKNPELTSINTFNDTVKKANEIKDRVLKYVYNIKQERSYNNDLIGIFERYKDIADGDMEVAMNFIKEAYPFNEETESFIRKKFDMPIPDESKEP